MSDFRPLQIAVLLTLFAAVIGADVQCPGAVENLTLRLVDTGLAGSLRFFWDPSPGVENYTVYEDEDAAGEFLDVTVTSPGPGPAAPLPAETRFYLVTGSNLFCGEGPLH